MTWFAFLAALLSLLPFAPAQPDAPAVPDADELEIVVADEPGTPAGRVRFVVTHAGLSMPVRVLVDDGEAYIGVLTLEEGKQAVLDLMLSGGEHTIDLDGPLASGRMTVDVATCPIGVLEATASTTFTPTYVALSLGEDACLREG